MRRAGHLEDDVEAEPLVAARGTRPPTSGVSSTFTVACAPIVSASASRNGVRSEAIDDRGARRPRDRDREQADRAAAEHRDRAAGEILLARREDGVAERLLQRRDLGRQLRAVVLPDHRLGHGDVTREGAVPVDAEDPRALAHVRLAGAALEAHAAGDVALGRDVVADLDVVDVFPDLDDGAGELVPERERRVDPLLRPLVPLLDVQVGAADRRAPRPRRRPRPARRPDRGSRRARGPPPARPSAAPA